MVDSLRRTYDDDHGAAPRVSVERCRRSLAFPLSPLLIIDGLSRKSISYSYSQLPHEPLKLSVLKLDGACFDIEVTKTATVAELKQAVEAVFSHLPQKGSGKISWSHVWGHFCLCYDGQKLVADMDYIKNFGIKDGDQLHFIRHVSTSYTLVRKRPENRVAASERHRRSTLRSNSCKDREEDDNEYRESSDSKIGKLQNYNNRSIVSHCESRLVVYLGECLSNMRLATVERISVKRLAQPSRIATGLLGGFRNMIRLGCDKHHSQGVNNVHKRLITGK